MRPSAKKYYAFVIPDTHVGYVVDAPTYSPGAWGVTMQALRHVRDRITHVIFLGDFGNWESLSHWSALRAEQAFIEEDVALVNARLDEVQRILGDRKVRVVFLEGNHEAWAGLFEAKYPAMRDVVNLKQRMRLKERGWFWVPENKFYALGHAHFTHGHLRGVRSPLDMIRHTGVSVFYGHTHQYAIANARTVESELTAQTLGCLASIDPAPPYARGETPSTWVHGFGLIQVRANGAFQASFRRILGECWTELEDATELIADAVAVRARLKQDEKIRTDLRKRYAERYYQPGGAVLRLEPHHGKSRRSKTGEQIVSAVARTRRAKLTRGVR